GFGADVKSTKDYPLGEMLSHVGFYDLVKFGLIPEFIGRFPIITSLAELSIDDLIRILEEPKNALAKQYKRLFEFEDVELRFTREALRATAQKALEMKTGARGLRTILENAMLDIMYELPNRASEISVCGIGAGVIRGKKGPNYTPRETKVRAASA
ncbi:MAG TPA: ATP-dependent Clp protease ATP-binding subunit ClpX, partial [Sumerlaeia bacterium]|nr:ATP-dependent Clp protease ATP-binding subunit ClpX [Sumerlaeia bacterium]